MQDRIKEGSTIEATSGCWLWIGAWDQDKGHGRIKVNGVTKPAHRMSYEAFNGELSEGLVIMHECDDPSCVNPKHLKQGTQSDNIKQMHERGRNHTNYVGHKL